MSDLDPPPPQSRRSRRLPVTLGLIGIYLILAYLILPQVGKVRAHRHPDLVDGERITHIHDALPGDPLNLALVGSEEDIVRSMLAAGWRPANALSFRSSARIVVDTIIDRPDPDAPVSNLYLFGRKEDLAFEQPIGHSPRERNHVRFWRSEKLDDDRPLWMGAATHDVGVELSRTTGQVTHRIAPDVDAERDLIITDLTNAKRLLGIRWIDSFHKELQGRNGGGDPWHTDGRLPVLTLTTDTRPPFADTAGLAKLGAVATTLPDRLPPIRRGVRERVVEAPRVSGRGIDVSVQVLFLVDGLEE